MSFRLTQQDKEILLSIAEYRLLYPRHIAAIHNRNVRALQRRLNMLTEKGLLRVDYPNFGRKGRPEHILSLSSDGIKLLKEETDILQGIPDDNITAEKIRCIDHLLLVNEFRVQLDQIPKKIPTLKVKFFSPLSPLLTKVKNDLPLVHERFQLTENVQQWVRFTPDGVFSITDTKTDKTLLFYLEADMGTETLVGSRHNSKDIRGKIFNYQACFYSQHYKRYEEILNCQLKGFRLLFLTNSSRRLGLLCSLVNKMQPSDFIWLTDRKSLSQNNPWDDVWARGGNLDISLQSILGSNKPGTSL